VRNAAIIGATCLALALPAAVRAAVTPTALVDTFVGTSGTKIGGPIDTFPGADVPFGMVQWSPDTPSQNAGGGYDYGDRAITGFSLTHLSGPGCSVFGDFAVLPVAGALPSDPAMMRQPFSHANEESAPGWYAVTLGNPAIHTELTVTRRTGLARFTFPATSEANLLVNAASNQAGVTDAHVQITWPNEISGSASSGFFCGMPDRYTVHFVARFDRAFQGAGIWNDGRGAWLRFDSTRNAQVAMKVGLSFVDDAGARANLKAEATSWSPIEVRNRATEAWSGMLARIAVGGGTNEQSRTFYTAFYHTLLHPNIISDVTGKYRGFDGHVHHVATGHDEYANYSDWDVYRTEIPLLALVAPGETSDMMQSLVDAARQEEGWLPRWALVNGPTSVMGGDSVDPVIAGGYAFGARNFDARGALAAMAKGASTTAGPPGQGWYFSRWELDDNYVRSGYVVNTHTTSVSPVPNGASETLEYALDDFSIARLAYALHAGRTYDAFMRRSSNWATLFNGATGLIAPRDADGAFMEGPITENGQSGFQEGNAAQYTWMVPHDLRDLIAAMGGRASAVAKLDDFFTQLDAGQDHPNAWLGNEPSLGAPWVYLYAGEPWRAQDIIRRALTTLYGDRPDGLPGNDDLGTMSAWYVWCAIGLYPQNPAVRAFDIGAPLFSSVTLRAPSGPTVVIRAPQAATDRAYVQSLRVNGSTVTAAWMALPMRGRLRLDFTLGATPNRRWGSGPNDTPPSFASVRIDLPPATSAVLEAPAAGARIAAGSSAAASFAIANRTGPPVAVSWHASASRGLHLDVDRGRIMVAPRATATIGMRVSADPSLSARYAAVRIDAVAGNGARLAHATIPVRVTNGLQRPALAYAENRFGNTITPIDLATGATGPEIAVGEEPRDAALSVDGRRLYVADRGAATISVVDTQEQRAVATVRVGSSPNGLALTPDGRQLWVANSDDGTIQSIDTHELVPSRPLRVGLAPRSIAIAPEGTTLYVSNSGSNTVTPVDLRTNVAGKPIAVGSRPAGVAVTPDGKRLYVVDAASNDVVPIDLTGNDSFAPISVGVDPALIAIAPDGRIAYVTNYANSFVTPIDLRNNRALAPIAVGGAPYGVSFTQDGRTAIVVVRRDNACVLIDVARGSVSAEIPLGNGPYTVVAP
jgi:predicted alpha-1,2-mannosidase